MIFLKSFYWYRKHGMSSKSYQNTLLEIWSYFSSQDRHLVENMKQGRIPDYPLCWKAPSRNPFILVQLLILRARHWLAPTDSHYYRYFHEFSKIPEEFRDHQRENTVNRAVCPCSFIIFTNNNILLILDGLKKISLKNVCWIGVHLCCSHPQRRRSRHLWRQDRFSPQGSFKSPLIHR